MNKLKFLLLMIIATSVINCAGQTTIDNTVNHQGTLRNMMSGNIEATMSLDSLQLMPHLYALGALSDFGFFYNIDHIVCHIHQPRLDHTLNWKSKSKRPHSKVGQMSTKHFPFY